MSIRHRGPPSFKSDNPAPSFDLKANVNESFISTASSHDLAVHPPQANASFDHVTGIKGVGRFNATKLNTYLHGLNRRLVEENEELTRQLNARQMPSVILEGDESMKALEIAALEDQVNALQSELNQLKSEQEKERATFKGRIKEVQEDVEKVVENLERELETMGEAKEQALLKTRRAQELQGDAEERARRAELALAKLSNTTISPRRSTPIGSPGGSGGTNEHEDFKEAIERVAQLEAEIQISDQRCLRLEEELKCADEAIDELKAEKQTAENKVKAMKRQVAESILEMEQLETRVKELEEDLSDSQKSAESLLSELGDAMEQAEHFKASTQALHERINTLETRCEKAERESRQLEEALETGEQKMLQDQGEIEALRREIERQRLAASLGPSARASTNTAVSLHYNEPSTTPQATKEEEFEILEQELDDAHREIGRLQHLLSESPARQVLLQAKDSRITSLEEKNAELEEQVRRLRVLTSKGTTIERSLLGTPMRHGAMVSSPAAINMPSLRGPKTPGRPLTDVSRYHFSLFH
jgi:hypothetical protein